jgi:hypothetical protein
VFKLELNMETPKQFPIKRGKGETDWIVWPDIREWANLTKKEPLGEGDQIQRSKEGRWGDGWLEYEKLIWGQKEGLEEADTNL